MEHPKNPMQKFKPNQWNILNLTKGKFNTNSRKKLREIWEKKTKKNS